MTDPSKYPTLEQITGMPYVLLSRAKLYVWENPYWVDYGSSLVFAVANSEDEARAVAKRGYRNEHQCCGDPRDMTLGPPTRVTDLPCAEWHRWEE